jgi:hypothetical protein
MGLAPVQPAATRVETYIQPFAVPDGAIAGLHDEFSRRIIEAFAVPAASLQPTLPEQDTLTVEIMRRGMEVAYPGRFTARNDTERLLVRLVVEEERLRRAGAPAGFVREAYDRRRVVQRELERVMDMVDFRALEARIHREVVEALAAPVQPYDGPQLHPYDGVHFGVDMGSARVDISAVQFIPAYRGALDRAIAMGQFIPATGVMRPAERAPEAEARGMTLLKEWLTPAQRQDLQHFGFFQVTGSHSRKHYRICIGVVQNVLELDHTGTPVCGWCFAPAGSLVPGDVMLAQKIALETDERVALRIANPFHDRRTVRGAFGPFLGRLASALVG